MNEQYFLHHGKNIFIGISGIIHTPPPHIKFVFQYTDLIRFSQQQAGQLAQLVEHWHPMSPVQFPIPARPVILTNGRMWLTRVGGDVLAFLF